MLAVLSSFATVDALSLPCQIGPAPFSLETTPPSSLRRGVYSPRIIQPNASTMWVRGTEVNVTWSTDGIPKHITNPMGKIFLGRLENGSPNEHLGTYDHPLANGFDIRDGHCSFPVPDVPPRNDYIIVLFGDSGNKSPTFTIQ
ncbi:hypothetical protein B0H10DRAFT_1789201 [Mycena sp. CBHHK59/15]|nr:hypothetical protein B0H10DRAFT_1789201 [Mycena sp. CBHHK59/15]